MEREEIMQFLTDLQGKSVIVKSSGYISCQVAINELEYIEKYKIITMRDKKTENFIILDLRKIKEFTIEEDKISILIFIDDEIETEIVITSKMK